MGRGPISLSDARARLHLSLVFTFAWWRVCLRARMQVGAKALRSANFWTQGLSPVCKIRMGMIEEQTAPLGGDDALTDPVWGQQFLLDFNPLGLLDIAVTNEQYLMSEEIGRVRMTVSSIMEGMNIAEGQGLKTWETYFLLLTEQHTSDPYKPGSNRSWFRKGAGLHELTGARPVHRGLAETEHELDAPDRGSRISAMGMYGTRSVRVPRVRGRLYVNFDLVEPHASPHLGVGSFHPAVAKHPAATESAALPRPPAASRTLHQPNAPHPTHPASAPAGAAPAGGGLGPADEAGNVMETRMYRVLPQPKVWPPTRAEIEVRCMPSLCEMSGSGVSRVRARERVGGREGGKEGGRRRERARVERARERRGEKGRESTRARARMM